MAKRPQAISRYLQHSDQLSSLQNTISEEAKLLQKIRQQFASELTDHITAIHRDGQVLTLYVDAQVWAARIRYLSEMIAAKAAVRAVRVRVSPVVQPEQQQRNIRRPRHSDKAADLLSEAANSTTDEDLKAVLLRLSNAVRQ